ncbi:MAG: DUF1858 domain-containing protein [Acholeplasmataceae bacterium]
MLEININETFYNITKDDPNLRELLVKVGFKQMVDDKIYLSVGKIITLKNAMNFIKISDQDLIDYLKANNYEVNLVEK